MIDFISQYYWWGVGLVLLVALTVSAKALYNTPPEKVGSGDLAALLVLVFIGFLWPIFVLILPIAPLAFLFAWCAAHDPEAGDE